MSCGTNSGYSQHRQRGEDACQPCIEAHRAYAREYYYLSQGREPGEARDRKNARVPMLRASTRLPIQPLATAIKQRGMTQPSDPDLIVKGHWNMYWYFLRVGSIPMHSADRLAVGMLGIHPSNLWPEWFDQEKTA